MSLYGVGSPAVTADEDADPAVFDESNKSGELSGPCAPDVSNPNVGLSDPVAFDESNVGAELSDAAVLDESNAIVVVDEQLFAVSRSGLVVAESSVVWRASEASNMVVIVARANKLPFVRVGSACVLD